jgi:predicted phage terminase large subunit-like protein
VTLREQLAQFTPAQVRALLAGLSAEELQTVAYDWSLWSRPEQRLPPGDWRVWLLVTGRGWGKTRTLSETVRIWARDGAARIAIVGRTVGDVRDVLVEGPAGILACHPPSERPTYLPSVRRLVWPSGAVGTTYSSDAPDQLRGPNHTHAIADEVATWELGVDSRDGVPAAWNNLQLTLRAGRHPRVVAGTTPRPLGWLIALMVAPSTVTTRGRTLDNRANLSASALEEFYSRWGGSRLGRQELDGEVLEDTEGSLFPHSLLDATRVKATPELARIVVSVDPSVSATGGADLCGISVCGKGKDSHLYVLADLSGRHSPAEWAKRVVHAYRAYGASRVIAEGNQGGALVTRVLRAVDQNLPVKIVHARQGKVARSEPIAALFEQGRAHIVNSLSALEDELTRFTVGGYLGGGSPDRADAMIWGCIELSGRGGSGLDTLLALAGRAPPAAEATPPPQTAPAEPRGLLHGGSYVTPQSELANGAGPQARPSAGLQDLAGSRGWR